MARARRLVPCVETCERLVRDLLPVSGPPYCLSCSLPRRARGTVVNVTDFSFDLPAANVRGKALWTPESPLGTGLGLRSLNATEWQRVLRRVLFYDEPLSRGEISADDPFIRMYNPQRCAQQVYIASGPASLPPLRRCKLAVLCAMLHVEDEPYARCIGTSNR